MADLTLEVVTREQVLLECTTPSVTLPGVVGELGILPGHLPILTSLKSGLLRYADGPVTRVLAVHYGYAQVHADKVTVLADEAEKAESLMLDKVQEGKKQVETALAGLGKDPDPMQVEELQRDLAAFQTRLEALAAR